MNIRENAQALAFKNAAERYCALLESVPADGNGWTEQVLEALACLYAAAHSLPELGLSDSASDMPDSLDVTREEWKSVHALAKGVLGTQEMYWAYFDPSEPAETDEKAVVHSLADDLADIYRDVKPGLRAWQTGDDVMLRTIVFGWKTPLFGSHWGVHAVSAMRALHPIVFLRGLTEDQR